MASKIEQFCDIMEKNTDKYDKMDKIIELLGLEAYHYDISSIDIKNKETTKYKYLLMYLVKENSFKDFCDEDIGNITCIVCDKHDYSTIIYVLSRLDYSKTNKSFNYAMYLMSNAGLTFGQKKTILSEFPIDLNYVNEYNNNILHYACRYENFEMIKYLISLDVKTNYKTTSINITEKGYKPIHFMFKYNKLEVIKTCVNLFDIDELCYLIFIKRFNINITKLLISLIQ